jgi:gliding motility-associated protein GldC
MSQSEIKIEISLGQDKIPESISWSADATTVLNKQQAKAMILSFWDGKDKTALRMDLWTKDMMVDEMADFFFQTMMTMADSYQRATNQHELVDDIKSFAKTFYNKFKHTQTKNHL